MVACLTGTVPFILFIGYLQLSSARLILVKPDADGLDDVDTSSADMHSALGVLRNVRERLKTAMATEEKRSQDDSVYDHDPVEFDRGTYNPEYFERRQRSDLRLAEIPEDSEIVDEDDIGEDETNDVSGQWKDRDTDGLPLLEASSNPYGIQEFDDENDPDDNYEENDPDDDYEANAESERTKRDPTDAMINPDVPMSLPLIDDTDSMANKRRSRAREPKKDAAIEVLAFIDYSIYKYYLKENRNMKHKAMAAIKKYYGTVFAMANQIYNNIIHPYLTMRITISGMLISESRADTPWIEYFVKWDKDGKGKVNAYKSLAQFKLWLRKMNKKLPKHDHAMSFTRYRLVNGRDSDIEGIAEKTAICNIEEGASRSLVHERDDYNCFGVIAHELGHSLGAGHDGRNPNKDCPYGDMFIMAPQHSASASHPENMLRFSRCSVRQMSDVVASPQGKCLLDKPVDLFKVNLLKHLPGRDINVDNQCALSFGEGAAICPMPSLQEKMCQVMWCMNPPAPGEPMSCTTRSRFAALPGTKCGAEGKVCYQAACVDDPESWRAQLKANKYIKTSSRYQGKYPKAKGPHVINHCKADKNADYCKNLMQINPGACSRASIRSYCCYTCINS